jgi:hypothetical protein
VLDEFSRFKIKAVNAIRQSQHKLTRFSGRNRANLLPYIAANTLSSRRIETINNETIDIHPIDTLLILAPKDSFSQNRFGIHNAFKFAH